MDHPSSVSIYTTETHPSRLLMDKAPLALTKFKSSPTLQPNFPEIADQETQIAESDLKAHNMSPSFVKISTIMNRWKPTRLISVKDIPSDISIPDELNSACNPQDDPRLSRKL